MTFCSFHNQKKSLFNLRSKSNFKDKIYSAISTKFPWNILVNKNFKNLDFSFGMYESEAHLTVL